MAFLVEQQALLTLVTLGLVVMVVVVLLRRRSSDDPAKAERLTAAEEETARLRTALSEEQVARGRLETERDGLRERLAAVEEAQEAEAERLTDCQRDLSALKITESRLTSERDTLRETRERLEEQLRAATETVAARDRRLSEMNGTLQELTATLAAEREKHAALKEETEQNRAQFVSQFKAISGEILQNQGKTTTEAQKAELEKVITPFKVEIEGLKSNLKDISERAEKERQSLGSQILLMQSRAAELAEEANGLARALRGEAKRQGNWGETILERILEAAGLQEGTHFTRQATTRGEDGARLIPDIVLHLPGERDVVIDSKVTLVAYQDMIQADRPEAEATALKRHVQAVRAHIRSLSDKDYGAIGPGTFGSVMMFLPVEGALSAALSTDPGLVVEAAEKRVHLMTPTTLMPVLQIVEHLWTIDRRNRNVDAIVDRAGKLHDKFVSVVESVQKIGDHLKKASDSQEDAIRQMSEGRGNVLRQMDQLRQLGAKARKTMPAEMLADGEEEEGEGETLPNAPPARALPAD